MRHTKGRRAIAYHEAGHAVIARVLTLSCGYANIRTTRGWAGTTIVDYPDVCLREWRRRGHKRFSRNAVFHSHIMAFMAGEEAEKLPFKRLLRTRRHAGEDDKRQIAQVARKLRADWKRLEPRLRAMTRMLVRRHRKRITLVAKALLAKGELSEQTLDKMVGRSVDDVRRNIRRKKPGKTKA